MGHIGRFQAVDATVYPRHARVIVRTKRGLEIGEVLSDVENNVSADTVDGALLRPVTVEDELLQARLEKNRQEAYQACAQMLAAPSDSGCPYPLA